MCIIWVRTMGDVHAMDENHDVYQVRTMGEVYVLVRTLWVRTMGDVYAMGENHV